MSGSEVCCASKITPPAGRSIAGTHVAPQGKLLGSSNMPGDATLEDTPECKLQLAQLEKVQLENERLKLELVEIRRGKRWHHIPIEFVPIITALVAIAGFSYGVVQY